MTFKFRSGSRWDQSAQSQRTVCTSLHTTQLYSPNIIVVSLTNVKRMVINISSWNTSTVFIIRNGRMESTEAPFADAKVFEHKPNEIHVSKKENLCLEK